MADAPSLNPYAADAPSEAGAGTAPLWLDLVARIGYAARGLVYLLVGGLTAYGAFVSGDQTEGKRDALTNLLSGTWGGVLLAAIAVGLVAYSLWRAVQAALDPDRHGHDAKALAIRIGLGVSSVSHLLLAIWAGSAAYRALAGVDGTGGDSGGGKEAMSAWILGLPGGRWILGFIGLCFLGAGVSFVVKAVKAKFEKHFRAGEDKMQWIRPISRFGLISRSVVFALIATFIIYAAWTHNPEQAGGLEQALDTIRSQPFGWILLAVVALGLFAFGCYSVFEALYRRVDAPEVLQSAGS